MSTLTRAQSRKRTVIALSILLVVLIGGGVVAHTIASSEDDETLDDLFLGIQTADIASITWENDDGSWQISRSDDEWADADNPDNALDQTNAQTFAQAFAQTEYTRTISADQEADDMGLDSPNAEATVTLEDGTEYHVEIGSATQDGSGYYATKDDSEEIYLIDSDLPQALASTMNDLYETEEAPDSDDVDGLTIEHGDTTFEISYYPNGSATLSYTDKYTYFGDDGDGQQALDTAEAAQIVDLVNDVTWASCVDPSADDLDAYGFDDPTLTATLSYTETITTETGETDDEGNAVTETTEEARAFTLVVGSQTSDGSYYAHPEGSSAVYALGADTVRQLLEASVESLQPDDVCLMDWDSVDSIEFSYDGESRTIEIVREETEDDEGNVSVEERYTVDGEELSEDSAQEVLDAIDDLAAEGEAEEETEPGNDILSITFHLSSTTYATVTLEFKEYDNSFYLVSFEGEERLLVNKNDVTSLKKLVADL